MIPDRANRRRIHQRRIRDIIYTHIIEPAFFYLIAILFIYGMINLILDI